MERESGDKETVTVLPTLSEINMGESESAAQPAPEEQKRKTESPPQKKAEPQFEPAAKIHEEVLVDSDDAPEPTA